MVQLSKERLENSEVVGTHKAVHELSSKMDAIARKQKEKEIQSIYPEHENQLPEDLEFNEGKAVTEEQKFNAENDDNPVMSMGQALEYAVCIDEKRMIDPEVSTGGLYEFVPATKIKGMEDWIPESEHYRYYQTTTDFPLSIETEKDFIFPEHLSLYTFEMGNCSEFCKPNKCLTGRLTIFI